MPETSKKYSNYEKERKREYTINPDLMQQFLESLDTNELTDAQKCGHILEFMKQQGVVKSIQFDPHDIYHRDANAADTRRGGSIDFSGYGGVQKP